MKVLLLVNTRRPFFDTQVEALERQGVECTVQTVPGEHTTESRHGITGYARFYASVLERSLSDFDVVHVHYGLLGPIALAQPSRPVVLTLWGSEIMGHARWLDWLSARAAGLSDSVVVPWSTMSPYLECDHTVVPWGVDTDRFEPMDRDAAREELGWDHDDPVVLFPYDPGRAVKNFPLAETVTERADVDARLETMSGVPYDRVPVYMNASDVVLVTSRRESGPMVVPEAAACNVPVVSTDVGIAGDFLENVANSHVRQTPTGLASALSNELHARRRSDGRAVAEQMSLDRTADRLIDVYASALDERGDAGLETGAGKPSPSAETRQW